MSSPDLIQSYKYTSDLITESIHQQKSYTIDLTTCTYVFADYSEVYAVKYEKPSTKIWIMLRNSLIAKEPCIV